MIDIRPRRGSRLVSEMTAFAIRIIGNSLDHASGFTLSNERRSSSYDSFGTADIEGLQEEPTELGNEPLEYVVIIHHLGESDEEDDGSESVGEEPEFL